MSSRVAYHINDKVTYHRYNGQQVKGVIVGVYDRPHFGMEYTVRVTSRNAPGYPYRYEFVSGESNYLVKREK